MRLTVMIAIVLFAAAGTCRAEDPLESLNTVEETLSQLAQYRAAHGSLTTDTPRRSPELTAGVSGDLSPDAKAASSAEGSATTPSCCAGEAR